jgi:hypothetical protein
VCDIKKWHQATATAFATEITENGNGGNFATATANGENTEDDNGNGFHRGQYGQLR